MNFPIWLHRFRPFVLVVRLRIRDWYGEHADREYKAQELRPTHIEKLPVVLVQETLPVSDDRCMDTRKQAEHNLYLGTAWGDQA